MTVAIRIKFKNLLSFRICRRQYLILWHFTGRSPVDISYWVKREMLKSRFVSMVCQLSYFCYIRHIGLHNFKKNMQNVGKNMEGSHYWILKAMNGSFGTGCIWLIKGTVECFCEDGNERLGFHIMQSASWLPKEMSSFGAGDCLIECFWLLLTCAIIYFHCLRNQIRR